MTTRAEMVDACNAAAAVDRRNADMMWKCGMAESGNIAYRQREMMLNISATLTRDGELRERLAEFAKKMWRDREARGWADELSALLKGE